MLAIYSKFFSSRLYQVLSIDLTINLKYLILPLMLCNKNLFISTCYYQGKTLLRRGGYTKMLYKYILTRNF